jgi:hypothetical protein
MVQYLTVIVVALSLPVFGFAQAPTSESSKFKPTNLPPASVSFQNLVVAKAATDKSGIMLLAPQVQYETRTRIVSVTKLVPETRARVVTDKDGKVSMQTYTVQVPVTEQQEQAYKVSILLEPKKVTASLAQVRAWQVTGELVESSELLRRLGEATHVFAVEMDASQKFTPVEPYFAEILRPGALVIYVEPGVFKRPEAAKPVAPVAAPAAPAPVKDPKA